MPAASCSRTSPGVPAVVDLAAMRDAMAAIGGDPGRSRATRSGRSRHRPLGPGRPLPDAGCVRVQRRPGVRAQRRALPVAALGPVGVQRPARRAAGHGIVHQVNLEYLAAGRVAPRGRGGEPVAFPDTLVGTDSHTTMVNGLGVLGYGVGGIEAEAVLLGQPLYQPMPRVSACASSASCRGARPPPTSSWSSPRCCATASWASSSSSRATAWPRWRSPTGRRSPTCRPSTAPRARSSRSTTRRSPYLRLTGRDESQIDLVEAYAKEHGLWREPADRPRLRRASSSGSPGRPSSRRGGRPADRQDKVPLRASPTFRSSDGPTRPTAVWSDTQPVQVGGRRVTIDHGLGRDRGDHELHEHSATRPS